MFPVTKYISWLHDDTVVQPTDWSVVIRGLRVRGDMHYLAVSSGDELSPLGPGSEC